MTTHTMFRTISAVALATAAVALAGCGEDDTATGDSARGERQDAALAYAKCMREHGVDMPDPKPGGGPTIVENAGDTTPEDMREAEEDCAKYREQLAPPDLTEEQQQEFKDAALAHARCMREHGIDMPDPVFGADGEARVELGKGRVDPNDPEFAEAQKACEDEMPEPPEQQP